MSLRSIGVAGGAFALAMVGVLSGTTTAQADLLTVDLKTNYVPGTEFNRIVTTVRSRTDPTISRTAEFAFVGAPAGLDFLEGVRVADFLDLPTGTYELTVELSDPPCAHELPPRIYPPGTVVVASPVRATRRVLVDLSSNLAVTVLAARPEASAEKTVSRWDD